jgi:hypothetical protein
MKNSIIDATVGMYRSHCLLVSGEEDAKGKFCSS